MTHDEIYAELHGLADSLDEHIGPDEVAGSLRDLAEKISPKADSTQRRELMTELTIDITDHPENWRDGDRATGFYSDHWFDGKIWQRHTGAWYAAGGNPIRLSDGVTPSWISGLRVTRTVPALPEEEGTVVRWTDRYGNQEIVERFDGKWYRVGFVSKSTTEELTKLIGDAEVHVAKWYPLAAGDRP